METILIATDFSPEASSAFAHGVAVARQTGAPVLLVHVLDPDERDHYEDAHEQLAQIQARAADSGVHADIRIVIGHADTALPDTARDAGAGLIAVGTHGRTGIRRFLMGSVAERVVRSAGVDVLVARGAAPAGGYRRVLVPIDFSPLSEAALDRAALLVAGDGAIDLFHAWQLPGAASGYWGPAADGGELLAPLRDDLRKAIEAQAAAWIERHRELAGRLTFSHTEDVPTHAIRKRLDDHDYDLVVMGSHGRRGVRRWVLGSVAELTVRYAPVSVYVVHAADTGQ